MNSSKQTDGRVGRTADDETGAGGANLNIRRFVAENSRLALRQVRDTLGGDAIILANHSVDGGVEVLAAAPEAVDALTRRMTGVMPTLLPLASPTELGPRRSSAATADAPHDVAATPAGAARKRLSSLFSRRTQASDDAAIFAAKPDGKAPAQVVSKAASSYADFADELAGAMNDEDDVDLRLAPETVTLSRPRTAETAPAIAPKPLSELVAAASVEAIAPAILPVAVAPEPPATVEPSISAADLSDAVAREVSREVSREINREFGRDVINDLTRDVSREVSREVSQTVTEDVTRELRAMQATLTEQLSTLAWTDAMRRQPARTKLMQDLILAGFSPALSRHIQERLPDDYTGDEAHAWAGSVLRRNLPVATDAEELINEGGVFALVGPTGVGKTTTVAKLAARFAMKHGVDQLALITTDGFRIGAQDQLRIYGKILGVAVHTIHDQASLTSAIAHLADKKLVLIDTAGLSQRDERVAEQIAMLRGAKAKRLVVLNATVDAQTLDHVVATFADREFAGCVITKIDEAVRLGPVLDAVIRHRLRIHHVSTGQKVPEDLERPDAEALVRRALTRSITRSAFDVKVDDAPVWMSAMAERAGALTLSLDTSSPGSSSVNRSPSGEAVHA